MNEPRRHKYDNAVAPNNPYGHTLVLLDRHLGTDRPDGVHLDLACGFGHIAEPISEQFGLEYVGVDVDEEELADLRDRGFEAHALDLNDTEICEHLRKVLDGRTLVSVSFLDGLEHLTAGHHVLDALGTLLSEQRAIAVVSVPNVTHLDVGVKAVLGSWDYTESGLLDETHYRLYSAASLRAALSRAGLHAFDEFDVVMASSDQHFPDDHVALAPVTPMSQWLRAIRDSAEPNGLVNQFVWALTSVPPRPQVEVTDEADAPFLSVVMRTQGRRPQELREALLCLAGQSERDFEVLLVAHKTTVEEQLGVERIIEDQPPQLRERIRLFLLDRGGRAAPVNLGIDNARGRYIAVFDDDDLVMGDWVAEFARLERQHGGKVLRALSIKQPHGEVTVRNERGLTATGSPIAAYSEEFSLTEHIVGNQSPCLGWVFPRSLATDFGLRYDESMTTTEDWAFLLRAAELAGVTDVGRVTSIYRWWHEAESSRTVHVAEEWLQNQAEIERRLDARPFLLPAGETRRLRADLIELRRVKDQARQQAKVIGELQDSRKRQAAKLRRLEKKLRAERKRRRRLQGQAGTGKSGASVSRPAAGGPAARRTLRARLRLRTRVKAVARRLRRR